MLFLDVYQEHGESINKIFFLPPFSGVLCDRVFALHYIALEYLQEIQPWITPVPEIPSGALPCFTSLMFRAAFCMLQNFFHRFFFPVPKIIFSYFFKKVCRTFMNISVVVIHRAKVQKEICVMDKLKNLLPICRWAVCSRIRLLWKNIFIRW